MMNTWKSRIIRQKGKASQTPGKAKGDSCKADWRKRYYMCNPHAYKQPEYTVWHAKAISLNT